MLDKPADATLGEVARQRLARVLAAQDKTEDALTLLAGRGGRRPSSPAARSCRATCWSQLGRSDEARSAYQKAKAALPQEAASAACRSKLDDLAEGDA